MTADARRDKKLETQAETNILLPPPKKKTLTHTESRRAVVGGKVWALDVAEKGRRPRLQKAGEVRHAKPQGSPGI